MYIYVCIYIQQLIEESPPVKVSRDAQIHPTKSLEQMMYHMEQV